MRTFTLVKNPDPYAPAPRVNIVLNGVVVLSDPKDADEAVARLWGLLGSLTNAEEVQLRDLFIEEQS